MFEIILKCGTRLSLSDLELSGLSYVPCGTVDGKDQPILSFGSLWGKRQKVTRETYGKRWNAFTTKDMTGVQIMTGKPTYKRVGRTGYLHYTSIDIESRMLELFPETVAKIRKLYEDGVIGTPCIIKTKSDGLRLDAFTEYNGKKMSFKDAEQKMLFEVLAGKCLARIDERYAMVSGSVLDMPTLPKETLQEIYYLVKSIATHEQSDSKPREVVETSQIGDLDIAWGADGRSQYFTTEHCQRTSHRSNRDEVRFTKYADGSVDGKCFNCGETWWEVPPAKPTKPKRKTPSSDFGEVDCASGNLPNGLVGEQRSPTNLSKIRQIQPITTLPPHHPIIASAPTVEVREQPSYRHFSKEERAVVRDMLSIDPDAGWHGQTPVFTTRYEYLHPLTNKFALNGQPSEVEKRRVWSTIFGNCEVCGAVTAQWIDRYLLTAGLYCDGCHKDYPLGSYLELELNRKLPNSIISEYQGFLGDDPEFADFRLWEPGTLTHLGAAMSTGKSTEIDSRLVELAGAGLGKGIIAVPLVALARFMAYYLRGKHGYRSWGLWHEGCDREDRFIGDVGAIVCLPSLPRAIEFAQDGGLDQLYVAIDEVDFGYNLLSLTVKQATAVKACLREATAETGLVVSGQTESTLALEAFAEEVEANNIQGFYNTASPAEGSILLHKHPDTDGKSNAILAGGIDDTSKALQEGHNVYAFCSSRRDADIIADEFQSENPVVYNAYTKGEFRADAVLRNQRLTDSRLFVATSAAGLGISILDPKAHTVVVSGLLYGSRHANMLAQEHVRDRGRRGGDFHYTDYQFSLPIRPTDNEQKSLYHESLKQNLFENSHLPTAGIRKLAYAQALASLADSQIETFLAYHLATVGNMPVHQASALETDTERLSVIASKRSEIRRTEREIKTHGAVELLNESDLLTTSEIRKLSNKGQLSTDDRLAHELANATACAVGWNDEIDRFNGESIEDILTQDDFDVAIALAEKNINTDKLTKQRRGYMAVHFPRWTAHQLKSELEHTENQLVMNGVGIEITAVSDDRLLGELMTALLNRIKDKVFDSTSLANATREVLDMTCSSGKSFETEIQLGALGASAYRKARFLNCVDDDRIVEWVRLFISEWYPARIAKSDDNYALQHANDLELLLQSFKQWLLHQPGVPDGTQPDFAIIETTELPDPDAGLRDIAHFRREGGETIKTIAESLNRNPRTIAKWCEGIKPLAPAQRDVMSILGDGKVWKASNIEKHSRFVRQKVTIALKNLLVSGQILKIKRGYYQKFDP